MEEESGDGACFLGVIPLMPSAPSLSHSRRHYSCFSLSWRHPSPYLEHSAPLPNGMRALEVEECFLPGHGPGGEIVESLSLPDGVIVVGLVLEAFGELGPLDASLNGAIGGILGGELEEHDLLLALDGGLGGDGPTVELGEEPGGLNVYPVKDGGDLHLVFLEPLEERLVLALAVAVHAPHPDVATHVGVCGSGVVGNVGEIVRDHEGPKGPPIEQVDGFHLVVGGLYLRDEQILHEAGALLHEGDDDDHGPFPDLSVVEEEVVDLRHEGDDEGAN